VLENQKQPSPQAQAGQQAGHETLHRFASLRFYGGQFVFDTVSGMFYRLSPAAGFLLRAIDGGATTDMLPGLLQREYGISEKCAVRDAELFLNDLAGLGVVGADALPPNVPGPEVKPEAEPEGDA